MRATICSMASNRTIRTFECDDCGETTTRAYERGRAHVCIECAKVRTTLAAEASHQAVEAHKERCRRRLALKRLAREGAA